MQVCRRDAYSSGFFIGELPAAAAAGEWERRRRELKERSGERSFMGDGGKRKTVPPWFE